MRERERGRVGEWESELSERASEREGRSESGRDREGKRDKDRDMDRETETLTSLCPSPIMMQPVVSGSPPAHPIA